MNNISWSKNIDKWGKSDAEINARKESMEAVVVERPSDEEILAVLNELKSKSVDMKEISQKLYSSISHKELYDIIIHLDEVDKCLKSLSN